MRNLIALLFLITATPSLLATDGVLEINQACAAGTGCFPGDEPGFPVRILNSGSYILTSNLVVPELVDGITTQIAPANFPSDISVALNLNGFRISSTTTCGAEPLVCTPNSQLTGFGVLLVTTDKGASLVYNGVLQGMAAAGLFCVGQCVVRDLVVVNNGVVGIAAEGSIRDVHAYKNGQVGIQLVNYGTVEGCSSRANGGTGFFGGGAFSNNIADGNATYGFEANPGAALTGNKSTSNDIGVRCSGACTIQNNGILFNTTTGIDFVNTKSVYGGNVIGGDVNAVVNAANAVQSTANACTPGPCP